MSIINQAEYEVTIMSIINQAEYEATTMKIYTLDSIEKEQNYPCYMGFKNGILLEVLPFSPEDSEQELKKQGFAKCDAPNWNEPMLVKESEYINHTQT